MPNPLDMGSERNMIPFRLRRSNLTTVLLIAICFLLFFHSPTRFDGPARHRSTKGRIQHSFAPLSRPQRALQQTRLDAVKTEFLHSWKGYKEHAWMKDELRPVTGAYNEKFCGWAATAVDTLDTLLIMGLEDEYKKAVEATYEINFKHLDRECIVNLFEVVIRHLGGMMAAYDLDGRRDEKLYAKIVEVGEVLFASFDTYNGMPCPHYAWPKDPPRHYVPSTSHVLAALGSLNLEFSHLSQITGDPKYFKATERVSKEFVRTQNSSSLPGLWPVFINANGANGIDSLISDSYSLGALSDSMYEYLPKAYLLLSHGHVSQRSDMYKQMWLSAEPMITKYMIYRPMTVDSRDILLSGGINGDSNGVRLTPEVQHLACFQGGMFAIAGRIFDRPEDVITGEKLTDGCVWAYEISPSGIAPETMYTVPCTDKTNCPWDEAVWNASWVAEGAHADVPRGVTRVHDDRYLLRPEAIESVFIMYRITGNKSWQEKGWKMFDAIRSHTRTEIAHSAIHDVTKATQNMADEMESFWLGETLKYFYLLFSDPDVVDLDEYVFNTEAHPFRLHGL